MRQEYLCEECGLESHVDLDSSQGVYANCEEIQRDHKKWSPECSGDLAAIRLLDMQQPVEVRP